MTSEQIMEVLNESWDSVFPAWCSVAKRLFPEFVREEATKEVDFFREDLVPLDCKKIEELISFSMWWPLFIASTLTKRVLAHALVRLLDEGIKGGQGSV